MKELYTIAAMGLALLSSCYTNSAYEKPPKKIQTQELTTNHNIQTKYILTQLKKIKEISKNHIRIDQEPDHPDQKDVETKLKQAIDELEKFSLETIIIK